MKTPRSSKRRHWLAGACFGGLFLFAVVLSLLPNGQRWYVLNPRYALWRYGWHSYDHRIVYKGLNGDIWRNEVVRGKTVSELRAMFSEVHDISEFNSYALGIVSSHTNSTRTFIKWADTDWFIEITDGRATAIYLWKG